MNKACDVVVVGGGVAGTHTAMSVARFSGGRLSVTLIDRNPSSEFGKKTKTGWSCGDAVSRKSMDFACDNIGISYGYPEIEHQVEGVLVYSPDHESRVLFDGDGYILNRRVWAMRQLEYLVKMGVEVLHRVDVHSVLVEDGFVAGVSGKNLATGEDVKIRAKVVVDASGSASKLRSNLPIKSNIEREIDKENDVIGTGRYIVEFERGEEDETWFDPRYCIIHLDQVLAPGGYSWVFPKGENKANIGLGILKRLLHKRNAKLGINENIQDLIEKYLGMNRVVRNPRPSTSPLDENNIFNIWQVPVRRQNDCLVANGFAIVGDAAWMPRPIDAGGIGPALEASVILGRCIVEALEAGDVSEAGLWKYNVEYVRRRGYQMASFEVLRRYLQGLSNERISFGMKYFLSQEDVESIKRREHPRFPLLTSLKRYLLDSELRRRVREDPGLAKGLRIAAEKSRRLIRLYSEYPENPASFTKWHRRFLAELRDAYKRLSPQEF
ncbi:MAG: NAD(P)/FAD-dependent oxidoreductase [Nitrososphaerota archaeon]|nr:NAD(P)/FAD-dependent oxidoreductase [Candidatus Calditenuaceae archaeon]MDW8073047.1 NAD(P)/FAD-dependent oxidoreductase [Nitrososphaerota archaeon]